MPELSDEWYLWGPYLSERQWGTVREDYSADGEAWSYLPHDQARSRAYRWGEEGLAGFSDREQRLCLGLALWNGRDRMLKERPFGLTGAEANHGEDVKDYWWYLDATPTTRGTAGATTIHRPPSRTRTCARRTAGAANTTPSTNSWTPACSTTTGTGSSRSITRRRPDRPPDVRAGHQRRARPGHDPRAADRSGSATPGPGTRAAPRPELAATGDTRCGSLTRHSENSSCWPPQVRTATAPSLLFCENETNTQLLYGVAATTPYPKDGINDHVLTGAATVNPDSPGDEGRRLVPRWTSQPEATVELRLRLRPAGNGPDPATALGQDFDAVVATRRAEADEFYAEPHSAGRLTGRGDGDAAGLRRDAVEQAALLLRRGALARR